MMSRMRSSIFIQLTWNYLNSTSWKETRRISISLEKQSINTKLFWIESMIIYARYARFLQKSNAFTRSIISGSVILEWIFSLLVKQAKRWHKSCTKRIWSRSVSRFPFCRMWWTLFHFVVVIYSTHLQVLLFTRQEWF